MDKYAIAIIVGAAVIFMLAALFPKVITVSIAIAFVALLISVITAMIHNMSVKLGVRFKHSESLHDFIKEWIEGHEKYYTDQISYFLTNVTPDAWMKNRDELDKYGHTPLYKDLNSHHLKYYKNQLKEASRTKTDQNLASLWEGYILDLALFEMKCKEFYDEIAKDVKNRTFASLGRELLVDFNYHGEDIITPDFIGCIYENNIMNGSGPEVKKEVSTHTEKSSMTVGGRTEEYHFLYAKTSKYDTPIAEVHSKKDADLLGDVFIHMFSEFPTGDKKDKEKIWDLQDKIWKFYLLINENYYNLSDMLTALNEFNVFKGDCDFTEV